MTNEAGLSALAISMRNKDLPMATYLVKEGKLSTESTNWNGQTVLFSAAFVGFLEGIKLLWSVGVDVDVQDKKGWTALMMAAYEGHFPCVEFLASVCHADINLRNRNGKRAFDKAKTARIQYLLSSEAIKKRLSSNF